MAVVLEASALLSQARSGKVAGHGRDRRSENTSRVLRTSI